MSIALVTISGMSFIKEFIDMLALLNKCHHLPPGHLTRIESVLQIDRYPKLTGGLVQACADSYGRKTDLFDESPYGGY